MKLLITRYVNKYDKKVRIREGIDALLRISRKFRDPS